MFWTGGCDKTSNVTDHHHYPDPELPLPYPAGSAAAAQPRLLGEYGGFGLRVNNHTWAARDVCNFAIGGTFAGPNASGDRASTVQQQVPSLYSRYVHARSTAVRSDPRWRGDQYHVEARDSEVEKAVAYSHSSLHSGGISGSEGSGGRFAPKMLNDTGFTEQLEAFQQTLGGPNGLFAKGGLGSAIWTQITDIECELNGFFTYDRRVYKPDLDRVAAANRALLANTTAYVEYVLSS
jgi:hypothetical protein